MKASRRKHTGFTLVELMAVLGILVLLGTVAVVAVTRIQATAEKRAAAALVADANRAVELYRGEMRRFPTQDEGLRALIEVPDDEELAKKWADGSGPYFKDGKIPVDPWGSELNYKVTETDDSGGVKSFEVYSFGPNFTDNEGTGDDIPNWAESE